MEAIKARASKIENLTDYSVMLCLSLVSVRSLELYQATAIQNGILTEEEVEHAKTIIWELRRLENLIQGQMLKTEERMDDKVDMLAAINKLSGKRIRKPKDEKCDI